jgi:hypothetical protein
LGLDLADLPGRFQTPPVMSKEKLASALRELLAAVRLADSTGVDDARYRAAINDAQAVLDEFDAKEKS